MPLIVDLLIAGLVVVGGIFALVGSYGLIKLPTLLQRLHAPTKATTVGVGSVLVASMLFFFVNGDGPSVHELVISLFLFLTAPITANFIAKAYMHDHLRQDELPPTGRAEGWATYDPPGEEGPLADS